MGMQVGDLVQFKQGVTKRCWKVFPDNQWALLKGYANLYFVISQGEAWTAEGNENKFPMTVCEVTRRNFAGNNKVPFIKDMLTKDFAKVIVFKQKGLHTAPVVFWVLQEDIEAFSEMSYLDDLKTKLKNRLSEQKDKTDEKL